MCARSRTRSIPPRKRVEREAELRRAAEARLAVSEDDYEGRIAVLEARLTTVTEELARLRTAGSTTNASPPRRTRKQKRTAKKKAGARKTAKRSSSP